MLGIFSKNKKRPENGALFVCYIIRVLRYDTIFNSLMRLLAPAYLSMNHNT